jgi:hypothetical protein
MSIPAKYLGQGLSGSLGLYQMDAGSLEKLGYLKTGSESKAGSAAVNLAANWTGISGVKSKTDFLTNPSVQEAVVGQMMEKNYQTLMSSSAAFAKLSDSQQAGLLQVAQLSGVASAQSLVANVGNNLPGVSSLPGVPGISSLPPLPAGVAVNSADIAAQASPSCIFGSLLNKFAPAQLQAITAQTAKITSKLPVSIPGPLSNVVSPANALGGAVGKLPGLDKLPGGVGALTAGTGGLTGSLGGAAGTLKTLPGGLNGTPSNLGKVAGKVSGAMSKVEAATQKITGLASKAGGVLSSLNKISDIAGNLPGTLNDLAGTVPTSLTKAVGGATAGLSLLQQYQAGVQASELGKKIAAG